MRRRQLLVAAPTLSLLGRHANAVRPPPMNPASLPSGNPLLAPWAGPYGGVPPFDRVQLDHFKPGLTEVMARCRAAIDAIAHNPAIPSFDNTLTALENAARPLNLARAIFNIHTGSLSSDAVRELDREMAPLFAAFLDETTHNAALFARIEQLHRSGGSPGWSPEQRRLLDVVHRRYSREGAALAPAAKQRARQINQRLASLYTQFGQNQLADEEQQFLLLTHQAELDGLPQDLRDAAALAAQAAGKPGQWLISNTRSAMEPFISFSTRRELREKGWRMWVQRGDNGDTHDNKALIGEILQLRGERARLLGFPTHAHWVTSDNMAGTPEAAMALLMRVWQAAVPRAREEIADMQALADREGAALRIEPWDYRHYAEKVRKEKFDVDANALKPYLELGRMREALFWTAGQLFDLSFERIDSLPVYHPDVSVYRVQRHGQPVGLWYFDPYARAGKNSGAWMNEYRSQEHLHPSLPIVSNNANFIPARPGEPVLISWDDAVTLFHEFGHGLHGLCSDVRFRSLAGTDVKGDFVEFPSQLYERWLRTPEVLNRFARHHRTGEPIPPELLTALDRARHFNQGFATVEYVAAAIYDMKIHLVESSSPIDPARFERDTLAELGCPPEIVMRHRPTHFGHIFADDGYSAGYYDYLWADTLTADAVEAFAQAPGGFYDKALARRLHDSILRVGNSVPPDEAYRHFRGHDADAGALMRQRGFLPG